MTKFNFFLSISFVILFLSGCGQKADPDRQWSMYRGNYASGVLDGINLPLTWDAESGKNIAWKTEIPGTGHSCPVVWGNSVFLFCARRERSKISPLIISGLRLVNL